MNAHNPPAILRNLRDVVKEYDDKVAAIQETIKNYERCVTETEAASCISGTYAGRIWSRHNSAPHERTIAANLLESAWLHVYNGLGIANIASAKDRKQFELAMKNPAPFTLDNLAATFGDYLQNQRFHILKGLAECFSDLDPAYKSHSKVKIGVSGLPKRIIISGVNNEFSYGSYGRGKLEDTINALQAFRGLPRLGSADLRAMYDEGRKHGEADCPAGTVRMFQNGNAHLIFDKDSLRDINMGLAEFYGEVLPDESDEGEDKAKRQSTDVSKDLAYYPTPRKVMDKVVSVLERSGSKGQIFDVLEPSCGDGRIMDYLRDWSNDQTEGWRRGDFRVTGIEKHAGRAQEARDKGHRVLTANFLDTAPDPRFDFIVMNPPFSGLHWRNHFDHARRFLKSKHSGENFGGGVLVCILPATAYYDGHLDDVLIGRGFHDNWTDLPTASFSESGTNVPTGFIVVGSET